MVNPLYGGQLVWNRTRFIKDPDTGKRVSRVNPVSEWQCADAPHLAIVDAGIVAAVKTRNGEIVKAPAWRAATFSWAKRSMSEAGALERPSQRSG